MGLSKLLFSKRVRKRFSSLTIAAVLSAAAIYGTTIHNPKTVEQIIEASGDSQKLSENYKNSWRKRPDILELEKVVSFCHLEKKKPKEGIYLTMQSIPVTRSAESYDKIISLESEIRRVGLVPETMVVEVDGRKWARIMAKTTYFHLLKDYAASEKLKGNGWRQAHVIEFGRNGMSWHDIRGLDYNINDAMKVKNLPFANKIIKYSREAGISPAYLASIITVESSFNPEARSQTGVFGLAQVTKSVAMKYGCDRRTVDGSLKAAALELKRLLELYGNDFYFATASYNAGCRGLKEGLRNQRDISEAEGYVPRVLKVLMKIRDGNSDKESLVAAKDVVARVISSSG